MKSFVLIALAVLACLSSSAGHDLIVGSSFNARLIHTEKAEYNTIPLKKRVKEVFYSDPGQQIIKVRDTNNVAMKSFVLIALAVLACLSSSAGHDLIVGSSFNARLIHTEKAEYNTIPLKKRVKEVFYSDPGQQIIKGIIARDIDHTEGSATVTAGGVGFSYVNLRLKSERSGGLNYNIEIYA